MRQTLRQMRQKSIDGDTWRVTILSQCRNLYETNQNATVAFGNFPRGILKTGQMLLVSPPVWTPIKRKLSSNQAQIKLQIKLQIGLKSSSN